MTLYTDIWWSEPGRSTIFDDAGMVRDALQYLYLMEVLTSRLVFVDSVNSQYLMVV